MKKENTHILVRCTALLTMLVFLLPVFISLLHSTQDHEHYDTCKFASETHVHESKLDCDLGDLQMVKVGLYAFAKAYTIPEIIISKKIDLYFKSEFSKTAEVTANRGPPVC